ncbi:MAG: NAD(P)H-hydrate dehydratase [Clostridiales Family XIII bacterium]|jgi:NAD(P)H-hydrate epimerase|nr:NAD(P)H-hydrate dehydratase [Clostridiales Family XIII bacterium]
MVQETQKPKPKEITKKEIHALLTGKNGIRRDKNSHKGDFGRVLLIAGSKGMAGAAVLSARAALRTGSGLVTVCIDEALFPIIQTAVPEAVCVPRSAIASIEKYDVVAVGPGIGKGSAEGQTVMEDIIEYILSSENSSVVLDADALNIIANSPAILERLGNSRFVMTPHPGEAGRLLALRSKAVQADRVAALHSLLRKYRCTTVLKGGDTLVATPEDASFRPEIFVNTTGNPGMATGGSGDVLTGVIASLLGQGLSPLEAAKAGVYIHGLAGDLVAGNIGETGLIAGDLPDSIALAIQKLM